jgi:AAA domain/Bifunctional DNA primase/polymerase, N-terminal
MSPALATARANAAELRKAAVAAMSTGLSVVPPRQDGTKAPEGKWKRFQTTRATLDELHAWYGTKGSTQRTGLGVVTGPISGNLEVLEFDAHGDAESAYEAYLSAARALGLGELVDRIEAGYLERSPSGGIHWFYFCSTIGGNIELARCPSEDGKPEVLIETRGEGGYIVTAPSYGSIHPSNKPYELLRGGFDTIATITPEERRNLWDLARTFDRMPEPETSPIAPAAVPVRKGQTQADWDDVVSTWDDYIARTTWPDILPPGWTLVHSQGSTGYWRRPGKDKGVSATTNRDGSDRIWVFSSSTPFPTCKPLSRFDAYALLHHGGDTKATAAALAQKGFGQFKTWVDGRLETRQNPCPKGMRIAKPGEKPPAGKRLAGVERNGEHKANGKPSQAIDRDSTEDVFSGLADDDLSLIPLDLVEPRPMRWLWKYRFAKGSLAIMAGDGGIGKSQVLLSLAASVSTGGAWPDGSGVAPQGDVIIVSAEDQAADTIVPRLRAMGADLARITLVKAKFTIRIEGKPPSVHPASFQERPYWREIFRRRPGCLLFIVDPLPSYLGRGVNDSKNIEIRQILEPFIDEVIVPADVCMIGNTHLNKSVDAKTPMHRISGSIAYGNLPRNVHFVVRDPDCPERRFLKQAKCNNAPDDLPAIAFTVERREVTNSAGEVIETAIPVFEAETVTVNLGDVVNGKGPSRAPDPKKETEVAEWIHDYLNGRAGWTLLREIRAAAGEAGLIGKQDDKGKWNNLTRLYRGKERVSGLPSPRDGKRVDEHDMAEPRDRYPKPCWRLIDANQAF